MFQKQNDLVVSLLKNWMAPPKVDRAAVLLRGESNVLVKWIKGDFKCDIPCRKGKIYEILKNFPQIVESKSCSHSLPH